MESLTGKVAKRFYLKDNQGPRGPVTKLHLAEHKMTRTIATLPPPHPQMGCQSITDYPSLPYFLKVFFLVHPNSSFCGISLLYSSAPSFRYKG